MVVLFMLGISLLSLEPNADELTWLKSGPIATISQKNGLDKAKDFTISKTGHVYVIQKELPGVLKFDMQGKKLGEINKSGKGILNPMAIESLLDGFIVADADTKQIHFFNKETFSHSVDVSPLEPRNLAVVGDRIFCSGIGYSYHTGGIIILDSSGNFVRQFVLDIEPSPHDSDNNGLWTGIVLRPLSGARVLVGFTYLAQAYILNREGFILNGYDLNSHYATYEAMEGDLIVPSGYAAISFCEAPNKRLLIGVCDNEKRLCDRLMLFDQTLTTKVSEGNLGFHVWNMKYFPHQNIFALIRDGSRILFYSTL